MVELVYKFDEKSTIVILLRIGKMIVLLSCQWSLESTILVYLAEIRLGKGRK